MLPVRMLFSLPVRCPSPRSGRMVECAGNSRGERRSGMPNFEIRLKGGETRLVNGERVDVQEALSDGGPRQVVVMRGAVVMARISAEDVEGWEEQRPPG